jgi:hypothetical protein
MATISTQLRDFKEPSKDQAIRLFFALPRDPSPEDVGAVDNKFEINAVLMLNEGQEDSYVSIISCRRSSEQTLNAIADRRGSYTYSHRIYVSHPWIDVQ